MTDVTLNSFPVMAGRVELPRIGAWVADLEVDAADVAKVSGPVTLALGSRALVGTTVAAGLYGARCRVRVVAGAGGLATILAGRDYRVAPARIPLVDVLGEGKETLAPSSDGAKLATFLTSWTRTAGSVGTAVAALAAEIGATWRVLDDGTVWIGDEAWPDTKATNVSVLDDDAKAGRLLLASDEPTLAPGTVYDGKKLSRVVVQISPARIRSEVWIEPAVPSTSGDRLFASLERLVNRIMRRVDYYALYSARVVRQNADGSVDVTCHDDRMPPKSKVKILAPTGVRVKVTAGAKAALGHLNGDPSLPYVTLWGDDGLVSLSIGGDRPVARLGDQVVLTIPPALPIVGTLNGQPLSGVATITTPLTGSIITATESLNVK